MNRKQQIERDFEDIINTLATKVSPDFFSLNNDIHSIKIEAQSKNITLPFYFSTSLNSNTDIE